MCRMEPSICPWTTRSSSATRSPLKRKVAPRVEPLGATARGAGTSVWGADGWRDWARGWRHQGRRLGQDLLKIDRIGSFAFPHVGAPHALSWRCRCGPGSRHECDPEWHWPRKLGAPS